MRVSAEIIARDVSLLVTFNQAIDSVIQFTTERRRPQAPVGVPRLPSESALRRLVEAFPYDLGGFLSSRNPINFECLR